MSGSNLLTWEGWPTIRFFRSRQLSMRKKPARPARVCWLPKVFPGRICPVKPFAFTFLILWSLICVMIFLMYLKKKDALNKLNDISSTQPGIHNWIGIDLASHVDNVNVMTLNQRRFGVDSISYEGWINIDLATYGWSKCCDAESMSIQCWPGVADQLDKLVRLEVTLIVIKVWIFHSNVYKNVNMFALIFLDLLKEACNW